MIRTVRRKPGAHDPIKFSYGIRVTRKQTRIRQLLGRPIATVEAA
jgi:hypothetical protein